MSERVPGEAGGGTPRDNAIQLLKLLGLTGLEAELYLLLLEKGPLSAPEISDYLVKHRPQIHVALTRLSSKGYIEELGGRPKKYRAVDPQLLLNLFLKDFDSLAKKALSYMRGLSKPSLEEKFGVWIIREPEVAKSRIAELLDSATIDALIMGDIKFLHMLSDKIEAAVERGVRVYVLSYSLGERGAKFIVEDMPFLKKLRVAISGDLVVVVDSERGGVLKARPTLPIRHGYLIEERTLTDYLSHDFMNRWVSSKVIVDENYDMPLKFTFHRMALYETKKLLLENKKLRLKATGYEIDTGARVEVSGRIVDAVLDLPAGYAHFKVETDSGVIRVGGLDAIVEEIAGEYFEIYEES
ncbi:TrmB family transcriptional regulator [Thermofilum pendens]|uniref:Transcriptional regulator, TrmB n=1 Tax=Thermofilum pendens (strain DSM 2475 / Hrk 5) TaxID=368408 RepID=A1RWA0_THEPD|nr:TrmB family transcriptional regulator [Thermofilum pendens]ABL77480.1 transcriptional regulator, TrmB [Thermofilum pendens Hrk 5]